MKQQQIIRGNFYAFLKCASTWRAIHWSDWSMENSAQHKQTSLSPLLLIREIAKLPSCKAWNSPRAARCGKFWTLVTESSILPHNNCKEKKQEFVSTAVSVIVQKWEGSSANPSFWDQMYSATAKNPAQNTPLDF